ncbi:hypothetical protein BKA56DRAFT_681820 [Ilyonectria sp. MPI-CAGE-AT-0026]|nr:hypothetical protein BKA56DRAFT_681820 [Ilyonectria sp. MPI-CAGE-AT-0026]
MDNQDPCKPEQFADPDVTGIGVFISFGISILLTIGSILAAYLFGALPNDRYNGADNALLNILYGIFGRARRTHEETGRPRKTVAFESFIQAMAGQQLLTGMALIVAVYMIRYGVTGLDEKVSIYSFSMAVNLALLSCITHLSTMTVLRTYYAEFKKLRDIRVAMMVVAAVLIIPQLVASQGPLLRWTDDIGGQTVYFATLGITGVVVCGYLRISAKIARALFSNIPSLTGGLDR